jgi:hypothetical protein
LFFYTAVIDDGFVTKLIDIGDPVLGQESRHVQRNLFFVCDGIKT